MKVRINRENNPGTVKNESASSVSSSRTASPGSGQAVSGAKSRIAGSEKSGQIVLWKSLDLLINRLDRKNQNHISLLSLINLVRELPTGSDGLPMNSTDKHLLLKILDAWKGLHRASLSEKAQAELEKLERILQNDGEPRYSFVQKPLPQQPEILIREDTSSGNPEEQNLSRLDMRLNLKRLGRFQIVIEEKDKNRKCFIYGEKSRSCGEVKRSRKSLLDRILKRGFLLASLKIRNRPIPDEVSENRNPKGVQLWG